MSKRINSKRKGKAGELELVAELKRLLDPQAYRSQQYSGKGEGASDVITPGMKMIHWECKRREQLNVHAAIEQAERDAHKTEGGSGLAVYPVVAWRKNNKPWLAVMRLDDLRDIASAVFLALASDECEL